MIYYFYVCSLTGGIIGIFLGIFVYVKSKNILTNKIFAFLCFVSGVWSLTQFGYYIASNKQIALTLTRISNATAIFIAVAFMHFIYFLTGKYRQNKSILKASIIIGLILLLFTPTKLFIKNVVPLMMFTWFPQRGSFIYDIFALFFSICVILSLTELIKNINKTKGIEKYRLKYILLASILGFIGGATTFPMVYNISFPPYGFILFVFYPLIIAYAIIKHHLMDIRLAITRGTVFGLVYSIILGFVFLLGFVFQDMLYSSFGKLMWIGPAIIAVILASIGPSIYIKIKEKAEWTLFTRQKEYQDTLTEMGKKMTLTKDLNDLLTWVTRAITVNVGVSYTRIFLWDEDEEEYTLRKEYGIERRKQYDLDLSKDNPVIQYLEKYKEPALRDEIISYYEAMDKNKAELAGKTLRNTGAELLVPSFIKDHMIGFLTMGLKRNHRIYTPEDINMFRILAGQASLAIENAQFYDKVKESEARLVQASKMSSIGQLATGFAHNINNPFNSIMNNAGIMKYFISKDKDKLETEGYVKFTKELYDEFVGYTQSIIDSAHKGADIVDSIKKFARPASGDKKPLVLEEAVDEGINLADSKIKDCKVEVKKDIPEDLPKVLGDIVQLEQVFMNFITNACDAMNNKENDKILKIKARKANEDGMVRIDFKDKGEGMSEEIKDKIFDYFFTTKRNAGTGLGLALTYEMIKRHNGRIEVESKVGEGTTFSVYLPVVGSS